MDTTWKIVAIELNGLTLDLSGMPDVIPAILAFLTAESTAAAMNALGYADDAGTLSVDKGGTGATSLAALRNAAGLGNTTGALPVANGGTGATAKGQTLLNNLGITYGTSALTAGSSTLATGTIYLQYE